MNDATVSLVSIMKRRNIFKFGIITGTFVCLYVGYKMLLNFNPDLAYEWITGNKIPKDVIVINYGSLTNDNLFHTGHYWEFSHNVDGLQNLLAN